MTKSTGSRSRKSTENLKRISLFEKGIPIERELHGLHEEWSLKIVDRWPYLRCKICQRELAWLRRQVDPVGSLYAWVKARAKKSRMDFNLTKTYLFELLKQQDGKCALSGISLLGNLSLDRIDSNRGYVQGNVQFVIKDINRMKTDLPEARFIDLCKSVSDYALGKPGGKVR